MKNAGSSIRGSILKQLRRMGKSRHWLALQCHGGPCQSHIYSFLDGDNDMTIEYANVLVQILGLQIVCAPKSEREKTE